MTPDDLGEWTREASPMDPVFRRGSALLVLLAWVLFGGLAGVVMTFIFCIS
jgi:hypothetical protein